MKPEQIATHLAARYGDPEKYDDLYQEAWLHILECQEKNLSDKATYWYVKERVNNYANYRDRVVTLPERSGSRKLLEEMEIENDIQDYMAVTSDHTEAYELKDEIKHLKKVMEKLDKEEREVLYDIYWGGMTTRELAEKRGYSHQMWHKYHTNLLNKLKSLQEKI